ncbi:MAG: hypothetical protein R3D29_14930 [Nitratireductor sp.]
MPPVSRDARFSTKVLSCETIRHLAKLRLVTDKRSAISSMAIEDRKLASLRAMRAAR